MTVLDQAKAIRAAMDNAAMVLTDPEALKCKAIYKQWKDLIGTEVDKGFRFLHGKDLYRTEQPKYTFEKHRIPGSTGTESLFSRIDESHTGTFEDPIPYEGNMALEAGLYYSQDGVTYICTRSTGNAIYHALKDLVGLYVEVAE
jgi:hypothetical protein